ncbi:MAG: hypothetical protein AB1397_08125 [bacterium]
MKKKKSKQGFIQDKEENKGLIKIVAFRIYEALIKMEFFQNWPYIIIFIATSLLFYLGYIHRWIADDGFISLRVVKHILLGYGPLYNIDERVEVYSHPLWIFILSLFSFITGSIEKTAVWLGFLFSSFGLFFGGLGGLRILEDEQRRLLKSKNISKHPYLPLGVLVISVLPPYWDFSTSGLETSLSFFWSGSLFYLSSLYDKPKILSIIPIWISLGPLIRPDFGIIWLESLLLTIILYKNLGSKKILKVIFLSSFLPLLHQIFRMGYFASFLPNSAFAKEGFRLNITQGVTYLLDIIMPYGLYIPILSFFFSLLNLKHERKTNLLLLYSFLIFGLSHILYITLMGGDFMHGRFLLPGFFLLFISAGVVPIRKSPFPILVITTIIIWSFTICSFRLKTPYEPKKGGIVNERKYYIAGSISKTPVEVSNYQYTMFYQAGLNANKEAMKLKEDEILFLYHANLGITGFVAGPKVHYFDWIGIADPIAARFILEKRGRPGHEKKLSVEWVLARIKYNLLHPKGAIKASPIFILHDTKYDLNKTIINDPKVTYAKEALECGLKDYLDGIQERLTSERFFKNIIIAWKYRNLRIPFDPKKAKQKFCGKSS